MITGSALRGETTLAQYTRLLLWIVLVVAQMLTVSLLFDFTAGGPSHHNPVYYVTRLARWAAIGVPMFIVLIWARRQQLAAQWASLERPSFLGLPLIVNLVAFSATAVASAAFTAQAAASSSPPWHLLPALGALLFATAMSQLSILMPLRSYATLLKDWWREAAIAGVVSLTVVLLADAATHLWDVMAAGTLDLSAAILRLYETDVIVDYAERGIRVGDFGALIWHTCSGFEGMVLVSGFVTIYLWTFRGELSFPKALILYPIGIVASWLLNSVRIAALVSIGAHYSPEVAVKGFHSQAGWIAFLAVALALMALSHRLGLATAGSRALPAPKATSGTEQAPHVASRYEATVGYLMPFVALMVGTIAMSVSSPHDRPVYILKAALAAIALWAVRRRISGWWQTEIPATSVVAGLLVGFAWIATSPSAGAAENNLGHWLSEIGPGLAVLWLVIRGVGTIALVPIAEELAFRGFFYRRVIGRDFHCVNYNTFSWLALLSSSIAFGLLHDRWIAGALAGAVFALLMLRGGRLGDAIIGHAIANALIFGWALAFSHWSLL